jgi:hypothetical protein
MFQSLDMEPAPLKSPIQLYTSPVSSEDNKTPHSAPAGELSRISRKQKPMEKRGEWAANKHVHPTQCLSCSGLISGNFRI